MKELGERIRARRIELGIKQEQLADRIHVTRQTISNYERGTSEPDLDTLRGLAEALDLDLGQLLNGKTKQENNRKKERLPFLSGLLLTTVLFVIFLRLRDWALDYKAFTYDAKPFLKVYMLLLPAALLLLGWTVMQGVVCRTELPDLPSLLRIFLRLVIALMILRYFAGAVPWLWDIRILPAADAETAFARAASTFQQRGMLSPFVCGLLLRFTRKKNKSLTKGQDMV